MAKPKNQSVKVTWAHAFRDIVVASINRGQLPILGVFAVVCLIIWRMPATKVGDLSKDVVDKLAHGQMWAYPLLLLVLLGWYIHAKIMRRIYSNEFRRVGREKSELQGKAAGKQFRSSDGH